MFAAVCRLDTVDLRTPLPSSRTMTRPVADDHVTRIDPYAPGPRPEDVRREYDVDEVTMLDSNENPLGPSPAAREVLRGQSAHVHRYPDGAARAFRRAVADHHDLSTDEILPGNGSDQLLRLVVQALARSGEDRGLVSAHSFGAFPIALQSHDVAVDVAPMREGLNYDLEALREAIEPSTRVVFLANPNNPTGTYVSNDRLRHFLRDCPEDVVVVVDEAYARYVRADDWTTALEMRDCHELLVVTRTFSKCFGLAGLRIGYAVARPEVVDAVDRVRAPFNRNRPGERAAVSALEDREFVRRSLETNERGRDQLESGLRSLERFGVDWTPSQTNFLLVETPLEAEEVREHMLRDGVVVAAMGGYGLPNRLRITIGTEDENAHCLESLKSALRELENTP